MTRNKAMAGLSKVINKDSVVICVGLELIKENKFEGYSGFIGVEDTSVDYFSMALGLATVLESKVVLICDDNYLLQHLNTISQIGVSECANLYILIFRTGVYSSKLKQPTITKTIRSLKGVLFNFGLLVHEYTSYFEDLKNVKILASIFNKSLGPLLATIVIDNPRFYNKGFVNYSWESFESHVLKLRDFRGTGGI